MNLVVGVIVVACALALVGVLLGRRTRVADDSVAEFRRQLGALSPDASRPVIRARRDVVERGFEAREGEQEPNDHGA